MFKRFYASTSITDALMARRAAAVPRALSAIHPGMKRA